MSNLIFQNDEGDLQVNSFYGGIKRGGCLQLTVEDKYVQLTKEEVQEIKVTLDKWLEQ